MLSALFLCQIFSVFLFSHSALAATWEWSIQPQLGRPEGVEQVRIQLDAPATAQQANHSRSGAQAVSFTLPQAPVGLERTGDAPGPDALVRGVSLSGSAIVLETANPAFGYVVRRPSNDVIQITVSPDPLGARWTPTGPAADAAQAAEQRQAAAPATGTPAPAVPAPVQIPPTQIPSTQIPAAQPPVQVPPAQPQAPLSEPAATAPQTPAERPAIPAPDFAPGLSSSPASTPASGQTTGSAPAPAPGPAPDFSPAPAPERTPDLTPEPVRLPGTQVPVTSAAPAPGFVPAPQSVPAPAPVSTPDPPPAPVLSPTPDAPATPPVSPVPDAVPAPNSAEAGAGSPTADVAPEVVPDAGSEGAALSAAPASGLPPDRPQDVYGAISLERQGQWVYLPSSAHQAGQGDPAGQGGQPPDGEQPVDSGADSDGADSGAVAQGEPAGNDATAQPVLSPQEILEEASKRLHDGDFGGAQRLYQNLVGSPETPPDMVEESLYSLADIGFHLHRSTLGSEGDEVARLYDMALGYNTRSPRAPHAYARLGQIQLKMGNREAARAYLRAIDRVAPNDSYAADLVLDLANDAYARADYFTAMELFQRVYADFQDSPIAREASLGLVRSLHALEFYEQELELLTELSARWPDYFAEHPQFLLVTGDAYYQMRRAEEAREAYMRYINILPSSPETPVVLTRVGDTLLADNERDAAKIMYEFAAANYPTEDGGLVAQMRLAKEYSPPPVTLPTDLTQPDPMPPAPPAIYRTIIQDRPEGHWLVPMARLELALWYLNQHDPFEAIRESTDFLGLYPNHELTSVATDIMSHAFMDMVNRAVQRENYALVVKTWAEYPQLETLLDRFSPPQRVALATAFWKENQYEAAVGILQPLLGSYKDPTVGEQALSLALTVYLESLQWQEIIDLGTRVAPWELTHRMQASLDYAMALALENENKGEQAQILWENLEDSPALSLEERANILFFMAKQAEKERDQLRSYTLYQEALNLFREIAAQSPDKANTQRMRDSLTGLMNISEEAGRALESLEWAEQYLEYVTEEEDAYYAHLMRMARLYQKLGDLDQWRAKLMEIIEKRPGSSYARMADINLRSTGIPGL